MAGSIPVSAEGLSSYPATVKVYNPKGKVIFTKAQRNLFKKYSDLRSASIKEIQAAVKRDLDGA